LHHTLYTLFLLRSNISNIICILYPNIHHLWYLKRNELHKLSLWRSIDTFVLFFLTKYQYFITNQSNTQYINNN
jgi:hypothetical protein